MDKSQYWDEIYQKKDELHQSWFQENPVKSMEMIDQLKLPKNANIIDIGSGESRLVDKLIEQGFSNISLLDISKEALEKTKRRLGNKADEIQMIVSNVTSFTPSQKYDLWHDRAAFHFLTDIKDIEKYVSIAYESLNIGGSLIISTFNKTGPDKCSGLYISKYSPEDLKSVFGKFFELNTCLELTHKTPWGTNQDFVYCSLKKVIY